MLQKDYQTEKKTNGIKQQQNYVSIGLNNEKKQRKWKMIIP